MPFRGQGGADNKGGREAGRGAREKGAGTRRRVLERFFTGGAATAVGCPLRGGFSPLRDPLRGTNYESENGWRKVVVTLLLSSSIGWDGA